MRSSRARPPHWRTSSAGSGRAPPVSVVDLADGLSSFVETSEGIDQGDPAGPALCCASIAPALRELTLARNPLGAAGVEALGEGLRAAAALATLDLSETQLNAAGVEALGRAARAGGLQVS